MAVQLTRTLKHSNRDNFISNLAATTTERPITRDAVRQFLRKLDGADPDDAEVKAAWTSVSVAPDAIPTRDEALNLSVGIAVKDIAPQCQQFVVATQDAKEKLDNLAWSKPPPRLQFRLGDGYASGTGEYLGEALHIYTE